MKKTSTILSLAAVTAAAAAVPATPASAANSKQQTARFEVRILGIQDTNWGTLSDDHAAECRTKVQGSGSEHLLFRTQRPHKLTVYASRNLDDYVFGNLYADGVADVARDGYETRTVESPCPPVAEGDPDAGPGDQPPPRDCGEKQAPIGFELSFTRETVELAADTSKAKEDLFLNCPVRGLAYSDLLTLDGQPGGGAKPLRAKLRLRDLMNRRKRTF